MEACFRLFKRGSAPGGSGWPVQHLLDAMVTARDEINSALLGALTELVNVLLDGRAPVELVSFIAAAPLTALKMKDGEVCPIVVGDWRPRWLHEQ